MPCADFRSPLTHGLKLVSSPGAKTQCITSSPARFSTGPECLCAGAKCAYDESRNVIITSTVSLADFLDSTAEVLNYCS